ncbi:MAG: hypothetical protein V1850_00305 [Candidatus Bathyarchaeota archaeon]
MSLKEALRFADYWAQVHTGGNNVVRRDLPYSNIMVRARQHREKVEKKK